MSEIPRPGPEELGIEQEKAVENRSIPELVLATEKARQLANPEAGRLHGHHIDELKTILDRAVTKTMVAPFPETLDPAEGAKAAERLLSYLADHPEEFNNAMANGEGWLGLDGLMTNVPEEQIVNREVVITAEQMQTYIDRLSGGERYRIPNHLVVNRHNLPVASQKVDKIHLFVSVPKEDSNELEVGVATIDLRNLGIDSEDKKAPMLVIPYDRFVRVGSPDDPPLIPIEPPSAAEIAAVHSELGMEDRRRLAELLTACQAIFTAEEIASFEQADNWDEAVNHATTLLIEHGIDPTEFFGGIS